MTLMGSLGIPTNLPQPGQGTNIPVPTGAGAPNVGTVGSGLEELIKLISLQKQGAAIPQPVPPIPVRAGDLSGNRVQFSPGSNKYNAKVTIAQSIGDLVAGAENKHELKKARDIAFNVDRINVALQTKTPANEEVVRRILYKDGIPEHGLTKEGKDIQKALDINLGTLLGTGGQDDKTEGYIKKARQMIQGAFHKLAGQGGQQQPPQQQQQQQPQQPPPPVPTPSGAPSQIGAPLGRAGMMPPQAIPPQQAVPQAPPMSGNRVGMPLPVGAPTPQGIPGAGGGMPPQGPTANFQPGQQPPNNIYDALRARIPEAYALSPQMRILGEAVQLGILPTADKLTDASIKKAEIAAKLLVAHGIISERDAERMSRDLRSSNRDTTLKAIARIVAGSREAVEKTRAGAYDRRTSAVQETQRMKVQAETNLRTTQQQLKDIESQIAGYQKQADNPKLSGSERQNARKAAGELSGIAEGVRQNIETIRQQINDYGKLTGTIQDIDTGGGAPKPGVTLNVGGAESSDESDDPVIRGIYDWFNN